MEMRQVMYFLAACDELSFTRAAKRCHVAQPSLSAAIQRLERELGGRLFVRTVTGVRLTQLARAVMPHLEQIRIHVERARKVSRGGATATNGIGRRRAQCPKA
jgi:DNA-binding transcriptional LysR family regulator